MGAQPTKEPRNGEGEAGSRGAASAKNHLIEEINAMTHDGETFMKIIEISQKLYRHYTENFLNEDFCKKLAMIYQKRLLQLDLETLRGIHGTINRANSGNNSGNSRKFQALISYQPGENEAFMVSEFKKELGEYLWNQNIEYKPEIYTAMGIPDDKIPIKIIDPQNRLRYIDIAHVNELLRMPTSGNSGKNGNGNRNSAKNASGNVTKNSRKNAIGNTTGNATGNVTGNATGNVTGNVTGNAILKEDVPVQVKGGFRKNRNRRNNGNNNNNYPSYSNGSNGSSSSTSGSRSDSSSSSFLNRGNSSNNSGRGRRDRGFSNSGSEGVDGRSRSRLNKNLNEFNENMDGENAGNESGHGRRNGREDHPMNQSSRRPAINFQKNSKLRNLEQKLSLASKEFRGFGNKNGNKNGNHIPSTLLDPLRGSESSRKSSNIPLPLPNNNRLNGNRPNGNRPNGNAAAAAGAGGNNDLVQFFAQIPNKVEKKNGTNETNGMRTNGTNRMRLKPGNKELFFSARGYNKPANVCGGTENGSGNGASCKMTKSQLCRAITDHFMVRGNIIAAILSTLPKKTSKGFEGGFCYQRFLNLDKCQVCLPHNYDELMTMDPKTRIQTMMLFINYMTEKECNEKNGLFRKLSLSEKMSLIDNARRGERFNRLYSEYTQNVRQTYMEHIGHLLDILNMLSTMEDINNEQLNQLAMKTKETIDSMYHLCQFYYLYAVIALLNANIKPAENNMSRAKNEVANSMESFLVKK